MADYSQLKSLIDAIIDDTTMTPEEYILMRFDHDAKGKHCGGMECYCDPEVFVLESLWRSLKHKRDC